MRYKFYYPLSGLCLKALRATSKEKLNKDDYVKASKLFIKQNPDIVYTLDYSVLAFEYGFFTEKTSISYVIESMDVFDRINSLSCSSVSMSAVIAEQPPAFTLAFPEKSKFEGILVTITPFDIFKKWVEALSPKVGATNKTENNMDVISILFCKKKTFYRLSIPSTDCKDILEAKSAKELARFSRMLDDICEVLTEEEQEDALHLTKFVVRFMLYCLASPKLLHPTDYKSSLFLKKKEQKTFKLPKIQKGEYYVPPHVRFFRDERFYKGKYESIPRGHRFTLVEDYVANKKVENAAVVGEGIRELGKEEF